MNIHATLSIIIVCSFVSLTGALVYIEASDVVNMQMGDNSFLDILKILVGVLAAAMSQVLNYWFSRGSGEKK